MTNDETVTDSENSEKSENSDEVHLLRMELMAARRHLADARFERDAAVASAHRYQEQLRVLRRSLSWRITRPLRAFRRRSRGGAF